MATEVWFRDPHNYVRELVECGESKITWNRGVLAKRSIDPVAFGELYYGRSSMPRQICIGSQGSPEVGLGHGLDNPIAVYPTWTYGDPLVFLEDMMAEPLGSNLEACMDPRLDKDERPVYGQEHRVIVTSLPDTKSGLGRQLLMILKQLQEDHPECNLMLHGLYSFKYALAMGFGSADIEPRTSAANKRVILASGAEADYRHVQNQAKWLAAVGMKPADLDAPRGRCMFNIRSAAWAGVNLSKVTSFRSTPHKDVDTETPTEKYVMPEGRNRLPVKVKAGDKVICDSCTLQLDCKQFRQGEVCSLTDSDTGKLAKMFGTRDSQNIVDGLQALAMMQANRLERAAAEETILGDISPEVSKMINSLFAHGVTLAKLLDPSLRGGGVKVQVGVVNGQATAAVTTGATPAEITGQVVRALEQQGVPRDKITPELVMATLQSMAAPDARTRAIEGAAIVAEDSDA